MKPTETIAYVGLGSNLGDRAGNLLMAVRDMMEASFTVSKLSAIYETEPVDLGGPDFLNMVAEVHLNGISATQMMARLLRIEYLLGRKDKSIKRPRTIDLDILSFGDLEMHSEFLTLPHPRLHLRRFVLYPFCEIAPDHVPRGSKCRIADLLSACGDRTRVQRWEPNGSAPAGQAAIY